MKMTLTNEIWKVISHHKWYEVSNKGRVKSNKFNKERILKAGTNSSGYNFVVLEGTSYLVHRLVAEAFISNPYNLPIINHIDKNINNNCVENLEWCDVRYNNLYSGCKERLREQAKHPVVRIDKDNNIKEYDSIKSAAADLDCLPMVVSDAVLNNRTLFGYIFVYKSEYNPNVKYIVKDRRNGDFAKEIEVLDITTYKTTVYKNIRTAAKELELKEGTIRNYINKNKVLTKYRFKYKNDS